MPEHRVNRAPGPPDECANCGTPLPRNARSCPECGADEKTGWREESIYDGLDLPDEAFADEAETRRGTKPRPKINGIAWYWWLVGILVVGFFTLQVLGKF